MSALPDADVVVDCLGRPCPVPVVELARAVAGAPPGAVVEVVSDDPASRHDVPAWARMRGVEYLGAVERDRGCGYRVRSGEAQPGRCGSTSSATPSP